MTYNFKKINFYFRILLLIGFSISFIWAYLVNDWQSIFVSAVSPLIIFLPQILKQLKINITEHYVFIIYIITFFSLFIGETLRVYVMTYWYDKVIHSFLGLLLFLIGFAIIYHKRSFDYIKRNWRKSVMVAFFFCFLVAFVWEGFEYSEDIHLGTQMMQDGGRDTALDVLSASIGNLIALMIVTRHFKTKEYPLLKYYFEEPIFK